MRHFSWIILWAPRDGCPFKREAKRGLTDRRGGHVGKETKIVVVGPLVKEHQQPGEAGRDKEGILPKSPQVVALPAPGF